ncbi:3-hydroxyacyl-CoA dehydrogenase [Novosphingobium kunmingense]|uniref:3-hydroxyacyl-CoA dehydrogenase n=1 Tax=Novosphingobium kunmingense TaxID=1211806 RepID=A0A2N0H6L7_9SPHN|nr:3-hydroxyacyl-CoA dehydrogenase [Novosphingobium kunmingense]PKB14576.1 3-hydroxyacyl-CoA dehydrogenase [Novosphingobium kunmingense]
MAETARIAIIGGGFIGRSWATLFAQHGHEVVLQEPNATSRAAMFPAIRASIDQMAEAGLITEAAGDVLDRITSVSDLAAALDGADYVQENVPEDLEVKRALYRDMDRLADDTTVLASSSSSITCEQVCSELAGRERCLVAHPANPPHLLRAVEVVPAAFTSETTVERTVSLLSGVGQVPVVIGEIDGFVMNRLQAALAREALALVSAGIADADAIDSVVKHSLGLRWAFMGPFETMDLNAPGGFEDYALRYGVPFARLFGEDRWPVGAVASVHASRRKACHLDELDDRRNWRDRSLAALVRHVRQQKR